MSVVKKYKFQVVSIAIAMAFMALTVLSMSSSVFAQCVAATDGVQTQTLYAGQTIVAGTVSVEVVGTELVVTYTTIDGWELEETHVWVGDDIADMPQTKQGNPKIGNFPYNSGDITGSTLSEVSIPLAVLGFSCPSDDALYYVAAHAALRKPDGSGGYQTETGWADGDLFVSRGMWGTFFTIMLTCDCENPEPPPVSGCETAFASGGTCFLYIDQYGQVVENAEDGYFSRWGWTNGPLAAGSYTFDIYAAAGQCDLNKGTLVGYLTVDYDGSEATITYNTTDGFTMDETQLYVGNDILPIDNGEYTVAPGQYGNIHDELDGVTSDTYTITGLSGDIYVVAHAVVCGEYPEE